MTQTAKPNRRRASRSHLRTLVIAGVVIVVAVLFLVAGMNAPNAIPGKPTYTVSVQLRDAQNLSPHAQVRVAGKLVGQVLHPRLTHGVPTVDLQLDPDLKPLRTDSTVKVRPRSAVGQPYVDLHPGTAGSALPEGGVLPAAKSSTSVPIDAVLDAFDQQTRARTQELLNQLGGGVAGRGDDLNTTLGGAGRAVSNLRTGLQDVAREPAAVKGFIDNAAGTAAAFAPVADDFALGFGRLDRVLRALDRNGLDQTLDTAPGALAATRSGLARTDPLLAALERFARAALPPLRAAPASLNETKRLLVTGRRTVPELRQTLALARDAVPPTLSLLRLAQPLLPDLDKTFQTARPLVDELAPRYCDLKTFTKNWSEFLGFGNADGTFLRLLLVTPNIHSLYGFQSTGIPEVGRHADPYPAPCDSTAEPLRLKGAGTGSGGPAK